MLKLFVASGTAQAAQALGAAALLRRDHLASGDQLEIVDVARNAELAARHGVIALPCLVRCDVDPPLTWVGSLSPLEPVLRAMRLEAAADLDDGMGPHGAAAPAPGTAPRGDAWIARGDRGYEIRTEPGAEADFRELAWNADMGLATLSEQGLILFANPRMCALLGVPAPQLLATSLWEHLRPEGLRPLPRSRPGAPPAAISTTVHARAPGHDQRALHLSLSALHGRDGTRMAVVLQDVATWRDVLVRLESQQERLEALVAERTRQLQHLLTQSEAGQRAKSAFLSKMSHEIRTPLNAILGLAHLLLREITVPAQVERLRKMEEAGRHLLALLTDILDLARVEADHVNLLAAPLDVGAILERVHTMVAGTAAVKGLAVLTADVPALPAGLGGDAGRITQCLLNLAYNAVKFTAAGQVVLSANLQRDESGPPLLRLEVEDTGPGVPPALAERLFEPFEQGPAGLHYQQGSGLGLAITRGLARAMGGDCGVRARPGGGSCFWFTVRLMPLSGAAGATATAESAHAPEDAADALAGLLHRHAGRCVLLAEDDAINREVATHLLERAGLHVRAVEDGLAAVSAVALEPDIALVLMDMQMPGLDGPAAAREIRLDARTCGLPIVALTANAFADDRRLCLEAGMDDFLSKPVDPDRLYQTVLRWLDRDSAPATAPMPLRR